MVMKLHFVAFTVCAFLCIARSLCCFNLWYDRKAALHFMLFFINYTYVVLFYFALMLLLMFFVWGEKDSSVLLFLLLRKTTMMDNFTSISVVDWHCSMNVGKWPVFSFFVVFSNAFHDVSLRNSSALYQNYMI